MLQQQETFNRVEMLLGSLIKMLGKTNERVDQLDRRVQQLEWIIRESQLPSRDEVEKDYMLI
ncbi:hypothetical protein ACFSO7_22605 [Bacillus sp. CGMCC 1.16607]|uniref:hypothetical protein n=1 Tax=Bacillus sp. CGMCC 1.16607 TaxID=3351842 RepID=UPI00362ADF5A